MKVCLVSTYASDGGAANAMARLHRALHAQGIDTTLCCSRPPKRDLPAVAVSNQPVPQRPLWMRSWRLAGARRRLTRSLLYEDNPLGLYPERRGYWSTNHLPKGTAGWLNGFEPDLFHLHWIGDGFLPVAELAELRKPLVWTLRDVWPLTGGCHYPGECVSYTENCGRCPALGPCRDPVFDGERDLSRQIWTLKNRHWRGLNITVLALSQWLADKAAASSLLGRFPIHVVPNALDLDVFKPGLGTALRRRLGIGNDEVVLGAGAVNLKADPRKGAVELVESLARLAREPGLPAIRLLIFGANKLPGEALPFPTTFMGFVEREPEIASIYAACDVFLAPYLEDNLPNTVLESMACGVPSVAFRTGGIPELVDHEETGLLAPLRDCAAFAGQTARLVRDASLRRRLGDTARRFVEGRFAMPVVAEIHRTISQSVLEKSRRQASP